MIEKQITVKNIQTNFKVFSPSAQTGKAMLILHGWPSSSERWETVAELLSQKNVMVIVPDLPGFGKSQQPTAPWSIDTYVEWLLEFCNQIPQLKDTFYLLGHSFGGSLSAKFAIRYTQRVEKLFLVSASSIREKTPKKKFFYHLAKMAKPLSFLPYYEQMRKAFYKFIIRRSDYPYVSGIMKETYLKVISDDLSQKLSSIKVPTVIIWGDQDISTPLEQAHFINSKIVHSKLVVIPQADHSLHIKIPDVLAERILENVP